MSKPQQQVTTPMRSPSWVSPRRLFEEKLQDLHKCSNLNQVKQLHAQLLKQNLHKDPYTAPKLISAFSLCNHLDLALNVFKQVKEPNTHLYNTIIRACGNNSQPSLAIATFLDMQREGVWADNFTYPFLLKACSGQNWFPLVKMVHTHVVKCGFLGDLFVPNSLIDAYSKCGVLGVDCAKRLFALMGVKDVVSWNSMVRGLVKAGDLTGAQDMFDEMPERDSVSWNTMLDGYVKAGEMGAAFELFERIPERNVVSWSTMVWGYTKAGDMDMAKLLFDRMPVKNLVPWTIIISGYAEKGLVREAMELYDQMEAMRLVPDDGVVISILAACAESGMVGLGERVHESIKRTRFKCSVNVCNVLLDMYAKCGSVDKALDVFNGMLKRDLVSWNCMLQGLAIHGHGKKVLQLFSRMKQEGFKPDKVTLIAILSACTHSGYVDEGMRYFNNMEKDYGIAPQLEHYGCMIDLLSRAGRIREAFRLVQSMPMEPNVVIWGTLLGACKIHGATDLAEGVVNRLCKLEPADPGNYSMLANMFGFVGDWSSFANVRLQMKSTGIQKPHGASSIEVGNEVHEFSVCDKLHPQSEKIHQMIYSLVKDMKKAYHFPNLQH